MAASEFHSLKSEAVSHGMGSALVPYVGTGIRRRAHSVSSGPANWSSGNDWLCLSGCTWRGSGRVARSPLCGSQSSRHRAELSNCSRDGWCGMCPGESGTDRRSKLVSRIRVCKLPQLTCFVTVGRLTATAACSGTSQEINPHGNGA